MEKIKLGVVGFGNMGTLHCSNIKNGKVPEMVIGAICDSDPVRANEAKKLYPDIPVFENASELFKSGTCDAVIIAVPHYDHPSLVMEAFECGLHAITEKPAGVYTKQVLEMNEAAEKTDKCFGIMYNQRTIPIYQRLRQLIKSGELGHIKRISWTITDWYRCQSYHDSASWRSTWKTEGGGTLINQNPHQLDLWQWLFGMPDKITAFAYFGKYYDIEVEDEVTAFFEYENGTTGTYITSTGEAPGTNRLEVACDMGKIVIENNNMVFYRNVVSEREFNKTSKTFFGAPENWKCEIPVSGNGTHHSGILSNFAQAIKNGTELLAPGKEGINGLTISNAIHLSAWKKETVDVKNFPHDEFYDMLQEKIRNSTVDKSNIEHQVADAEGSY
ncbi:MAG: Gfo/Idh/MocA family oxidoreductase [Clostridia bacterium]|nr:Gfo/Idh/MocA family oxidoreductase [Clostridia bacterium]